ncbi:type II toxin-antitoxin system RelE/ParE family toxin [Bradyrhizobium sp. HKCCYLS20291]|uniref:type II toxin-antitoxin system RelE/ParE family toxin n=1 Tax=Bradyrhizobium sp. HKCCYLS20291 TaxID=3420766 RepID=UPI003EBF2E80
MKIAIHAAAAADLEAIFAWISQDSPKAAASLLSRVRARINHLARPGLAFIGRPGLVAGTRELIEGPYIIVYEVDTKAKTITVLAVVHGARDRRF